MIAKSRMLFRTQLCGNCGGLRLGNKECRKCNPRGATVRLDAVVGETHTTDRSGGTSKVTAKALRRNVR